MADKFTRINKQITTKIEAPDNGLPTILLIQASSRNTKDCPDHVSKSRRLVDHIVENYSDQANFDIFDMSIQMGRPTVQPCKGCVSTAGGFHCHWREDRSDMGCTCYSSDKKLNKQLNGPEKTDLLKQENVYRRLSDADGFIVVTPVNWYASTDQLKTMFDRLVCANLTITGEEAEELFDGDIKNAKLTMPMSKDPEAQQLLQNHLEGKLGGFFMQGDNGADDYLTTPRPATYNLEEEEASGVADPMRAIAPYVWQCRYSGINVPDELVHSKVYNANESYAESNEDTEDEMFLDMNAFMERYLIALSDPQIA